MVTATVATVVDTAGTAVDGIAVATVEPEGIGGAATTSATQSTCFASAPNININHQNPFGSTHLADIQVVACGVKLGVVAVEQGRVDPVRLGDIVAGVVRGYDVRRRTVLALVSDTDVRAGLEVGARSVNVPQVRGRELVATEGVRRRQSEYTVTYVETLFAAEMESQISPS